MHKFILFGPQGSGKGTQSRLLSRAYDFVHISIGDIFRWHVAHHTKLAARVRRITDQGLLVPDDIVEEVVKGRLEQHDWNWGFVLDGFPRTRRQAEYLFERWNMDNVIYLDLSDEAVSARILHRAKVGEGQGFTKRVDDNPDSLRVRMREYHEKTAPLLELYKAKDMLVTVDASRSVTEIFEDIRARLGLGEPSNPRALQEVIEEEEAKALR